MQIHAEAATLLPLRVATVLLPLRDSLAPPPPVLQISEGSRLEALEFPDWEEHIDLGSGELLAGGSDSIRRKEIFLRS